MENLQVILSLVVTIVGFITSTVAFMIQYIKSISARRAAEGQIKIEKVLLQFIAEAEKLEGYSGQERKDYVIKKAREYTKEHALIYDLQALSEQIEEIIALTKKVNANQ